MRSKEDTKALLNRGKPKPREYIPMKDRLAAALVHRRDDDGNHIIDPEAATKMTAEEIIAFFRLDHIVPREFLKHDLKRANHPSNLNWMTKVGHDEKTEKIDRPAIDKVRRSVKKEKKRAAKKARALACAPMTDEKIRGLIKEGTATVNSRRKSQWPQGRKMQSRPFTKKSGRGR